MHIYEVEVEPAEPDGFAAIVPAVPGLLVLGSDVDEVLRRVRVAIASHAGCGLFPIRLAVRRKDRGERLPQPPPPRRGQRDLQPREPVDDRAALGAGLRRSATQAGHQVAVSAWARRDRQR